MLKFSENHEWVKLDGEVATVGITQRAQELLGDLVFIELPEIGKVLEKGDAAAVVESVKAASDVYAPVGGTITAVNSAIVANPTLVNTDPMSAGWFFKLKVADASALDDLMDEPAYKALIS